MGLGETRRNLSRSKSNTQVKEASAVLDLGVAFLIAIGTMGSDPLFRCVQTLAYFVTQGIGLPCANMPGPKGVVSPVSGLVG